MNKKEFFLMEDNSKNSLLEKKNKNAKKPISLKEAFKIFPPQVKNTISTTNSSRLKTKKLMQDSNLWEKDDVRSPSGLRTSPSMKKTEYKLETFQRSNQDTCLTHKPAVFEGDWVQSGDFLTDCANSVGGELSLGQNIFIAYMPWEGYNFEDAILISERLVSDDVFTSVHIERYEMENIQKNDFFPREKSLRNYKQQRLTNKEIAEKMKNKDKNKKGNKVEGLSTSGLRTTKTSQTPTTKKGQTQLSIPQTRTTLYEEITRDIPDVSPEEISHLDSFGIVKIGSFIEEGDILVGKITPINKKEFTPYQKLLYTILDKQIRPYRDSSLRAPKGIKAKVMDIKIFVKPGSVVRSPLAISPYAAKYNTKLNFFQNLENSHREFSSLQNYSKFPRGQVSFYPPLKKNKKTKKLRVSLKKNGGPEPTKKFPKNYLFSNSANPRFLRNAENLKSPTLAQQKRKTYLQFTKRTDLKPGAFNDPIRNLTKSFLKTKKMRNILLQGWKPQHSLYSILGEDVQSTSYASNAPLRKSKRENKNIFPSQFSQISSYSNKFAKSPRVLRTLDSIVKGHFKNQKINKQLKKELNKEDFLSGFSTKNRMFFPRKNIQKFSKSIKDIETIHIYLAEKRKIQVGDKMSGRHGNKGIVSQILPMQDMPFLPDGTPIDMVLNPLGVPSRMNVGQIYECLLGLAGKYLGEHYRISSFDEIYGPDASRSFVFHKLYEARCKTGFKWLFNPQYPGKIRIYDGRTGDCYHQPVTVGQAYMLRLVHMVDDKIHMRSTGPYSLVTQQPLRGRSKQGGQRLGEMEVWALEGYGAAFTLLEMLTVKSDDLTGRMTLWSNLILNKDLTIGTPEAFKVLICELQALCLDIGLFRYNTVNSTTSPLREGSDNNPSNISLLDSYNNKSNIIKGPHQKKSLTEMTSLMSFP